MTLRDTLALANVRLRSHRPPVLPPPALPRVVAEVLRRLDRDGTPPTAVDLAPLIRAFRQATAEGTLAQFSPRQWRQVCWGLWDPPQPLAEEPTFLDALLQRLQASPSRSLCRTLIAVYLVNFNSARQSMRRVGTALAAAVARWDWPWLERQQRFSLFDPDRGPWSVGLACLEGEAAIAETLETAGLSGGRRGGGMEQAAFRAALDRLTRRFLGNPAAAAAALDRTLAWYEDGIRNSGAVAFRAVRADLASALLSPWQRAAPAEPLRQRITDFLLKHFKDPRLHPENWTHVPDEATAVLRRWLTRVALEQFLDVVDRVAERGHWMYRRPFWMSYEKLNVIDDAWVLFGPAAARLADGVFESAASYGRIDRPRLYDHSIILMRIGGLTIAEVSHAGKCRIWGNDNRAAPNLYKQSYKLAELEREPELEVMHLNSLGWNWQRKVADFIYRRTGIRPAESDWRPTR